MSGSGALSISSGPARVSKKRQKSKTPLGLPAPRKPLQLTWEPRVLAVGEDETTKLILRPKTTMQKCLPFAQTPWDDSTAVTLAEFFEAYQEEMRKYVDAQVAASTGPIAMIKDQVHVENVVLKDAVRTMEFNMGQMQKEIHQLLLARDDLTAPEDAMDLDLPEPSLPDYVYFIQDAISKGQLVIQAPEPAIGRPRAQSAFTEEQFPLPIRPPPVQTPTPINPGWQPRGLEIGSSTPLPPLGRGLTTGLFGGSYGTPLGGL
jgi:hypothetical protein